MKGFRVLFLVTLLSLSSGFSLKVHVNINILLQTTACECVVITTRKCVVVMFSVASVCVSVCLSVSNALTVESFDRDSLFLVFAYVFRISMLCSYIKVMGSRSRSQEQKSMPVYHVRGWPCLRLKSNLGVFWFL